MVRTISIAPLLLKLDAEGAEYEIIDRLVETDAIKEINAAAIEWHDSAGVEYLTSHLLASGFQSQAKPLEPDGSIGMIDAWSIEPGLASWRHGWKSADNSDAQDEPSPRCRSESACR
jgi:hypothetical protein